MRPLRSLDVHVVLATLLLAPPIFPQTADAPVVANAPAPSAPVAVITLDPWRTRWTVTATVGGQPRKYLFDTGGGLTLVSSAAATAAGCTPWGRLTGFNMFGERGDTPRCDSVAFDIGGRRYMPPVTGVIDMGKLNPRDADLDGIIALNLFADRALTIDLAGGRIIVESDASLAERVRDLTPLPARLNREVGGFALSVFAGVPSSGGLLWMELDSGNGGTVLVSKPVAHLLGLDPNAKDRQTADFPVAGSARVRSADVFTPDMIMDGNLGMPFLREWVVTVDLRTGKAWLRPAKA
jgi:hypothetical protein